MIFDTRLLRYVLAVADELHFGRAAAKLYVSQPALSEAIRAVERELGVELFNRSSRHVELTEAGKIFVAQARLLLEQAERSIELVRGTARAEAGILRLGYSPFINLDWLYALRTRILLRVGDQPMIEFISSQTAQQHEMLLRGQLQAGIVLAPLNDPALTVHVLFREPFFVAVARSHRFATSDEITLAQLSGEAVNSLSRQLNTAQYDQFF
jgi:LysR family transcriptional regulator, hca operon transcriptional activator